MNHKYLYKIKKYPFFEWDELDDFYSSKNIIRVYQNSINHETLSFISHNISNFKLLIKENGKLLTLIAIDLSKNNNLYFTMFIVMDDIYYNSLSKINNEFININHLDFCNIKNYVLNNLLLK